MSNQSVLQMKSREDHFKWQITSSLGPGSAVGKKWQNTEWNGFKKSPFSLTVEPRPTLNYKQTQTLFIKILHLEKLSFNTPRVIQNCGHCGRHIAFNLAEVVSNWRDLLLVRTKPCMIHCPFGSVKQPPYFCFLMVSICKSQIVDNIQRTGY